MVATLKPTGESDPSGTSELEELLWTSSGTRGQHAIRGGGGTVFTGLGAFYVFFFFGGFFFFCPWEKGGAGRGGGNFFFWGGGF